MAVKEIEHDRFKGRQSKCAKCCYNETKECGNQYCYSNERSDKRDVYFVAEEDL